MYWKSSLVLTITFLVFGQAYPQSEKNRASSTPFRWPSPGPLLAEPAEAELEDLNMAEVFASAKQRLKEAGDSLLTWQKAIDNAESDRAEERARRGRLEAALAYAAAAEQMDLALTPVILQRMKASGFHEGKNRDLFEKAQAAYDAAAAEFKPGNTTSSRVLQARQHVQQVVLFKALEDALNGSALLTRMGVLKDEARAKETVALRERALGVLESTRKALAEGSRERIAEATKNLAEGRRHFSALIGLIAVRERFVLKGHAMWVQRVAFSLDGQSLASSSDNELKIWDLQKGQEKITVKDAGRVIGTSPHGKHFIGIMSKNAGGGTTGNWTYTMNWCEVSSGARQEKATLKESILQASPDAKLIVSAALGSVRLCDATTGNEVLTLNGEMGGFVNNAVFSADGKRIMAASNYFVKVWETGTGKELVSLKPSTSGQLKAVISPDGTRLALVGIDGYNSLTIWDVATSQRVQSLPGYTGTIYGISFSPDGKRLATGDSDKLVKVWDVASGQDLLTLSGHADVVYSVAFSPDGKSLASTGGKNDRSVRVWELDADALTVPAAPKVDVVKKSEPKKQAPLSKEEVIAAWKKAGCLAGWIKLDPKSASVAYPTFRRGGIQGDGEILAFFVPKDKPIVFAQLPHPEEGFALVFTGYDSSITDATLQKLGAFKKLQALSLSGATGLKDSGLKGLAGLKELHTLNLDYCGIGDDGLRELAALEGLQQLSVGSCYQVTEAGIRHLSGSKHLRALDISQTRIADGGCKEVAALKGLKRLKVGSIDLSDDGMKAFAAMEQLESLELSAGVGNRGIKHLAGLQKLQTLKLFCSSVTDAGLKELSALKGLKELLIYESQVTDVGLKALAQLNSLERLAVPAQLVTDAGMKELGNLKNLEYLALHSSKITDAGLKELSGLKNLFELEIQGAKVSDAAVAELAKELPELRIRR